jgi:hypothetical protein
MATWIEKQ